MKYRVILISLLVAVSVGGVAQGQSFSELRTQAVYLDPRLIVSNADAYVGKNVYVQGEAVRVLQEEESTFIQFTAKIREPGMMGTATIAVFLFPKAPTLLSQECYRFYGLVAGYYPMTMLLTGEVIEVPVLAAYSYEKSARIGFYGCEKP